MISEAVLTRRNNSEEGYLDEICTGIRGSWKGIKTLHWMVTTLISRVDSSPPPSMANSLKEQEIRKESAKTSVRNFPKQHFCLSKDQS